MIYKGNHVKFARFVLLAVSEEDFSKFASLAEQVIEKIVEDKDTQNTKRSTKVAKELFADYVKEKKLSKPEEKEELTQTLKTYILCRGEKERIRSMYDKSIIRFGFLISRIIEVSVRVIRLITPTSTLITLDITKT